MTQPPIRFSRARLPYYVTRRAIEATYDRPRIWTQAKWMGGTMALFVGVLGFGPTLSIQFLDSWLQVAAFIIALVGFGFGIALMWTAGGAALDALSYGDEEEHQVMACLGLWSERRYNSETLKAIGAMAERGSATVSIATVMPVALLTAIATVAAIGELPLMVGVIFAEVVVLILLTFALIIGQGHADTVILKALAEVERRETVERQRELRGALGLPSEAAKSVPGATTQQPVKNQRSKDGARR